VVSTPLKNISVRHSEIPFPTVHGKSFKNHVVPVTTKQIYIHIYPYIYPYIIKYPIFPKNHKIPGAREI